MRLREGPSETPFTHRGGLPLAVVGYLPRESPRANTMMSTLIAARLMAKKLRPPEHPIGRGFFPPTKTKKHQPQSSSALQSAFASNPPPLRPVLIGFPPFSAAHTGSVQGIDPGAIERAGAASV
jgi:hypothetical protein